MGIRVVYIEAVDTVSDQLHSPDQELPPDVTVRPGHGHLLRALLPLV
jgi:hypothetical protein